MNKSASLVLAALAAALLMSPAAWAASEPVTDCLTCHRLKTPAAVRQWEASAHARARVGCADCHGSDHSRIEKGEARVDLKVCGRCHAKALRDHTASRHGMGLHSGWGCTRGLPNRDPAECRFCHEEGSSRPLSQIHCARFLKQTSAMGELGCNRCHQVERSCASCHSNHGTDLRIVRDPGVCAKCHMGPDHPQWEMWQTSQHGTLYATAGAVTAPSCQTCHMPVGSHDVSRGLTITPGGEIFPQAEAEDRRREMVQICSSCHAAGFANRELARGDQIRDQSLALVKEAQQIIGDLADRGLLDPMPAARPPHPLRGGQLVLDNQILYEETSHIERLFFKMKKYDLAKTFKGAYHQNPAYTHWYGNAELKMDLVDIKAEASRLRARRGGGGEARPASTVENVEEQLQILKNKAERGAITPAEYERERRRLLEKALEPGKTR